MLPERGAFYWAARSGSGHGAGALYIADMNPETARLAAKELQLEQSAAAPVIFHGYSMWPFLKEDDALVIVPVRFEDVSVGDIVTFRRADKFPTYRVVLKTDGVLTMQGDNWPDALVDVPAADVLGRVIARQRAGQWLDSSAWTWRAVTWFRTRRFVRRHRRGITRVLRSLLGFTRRRP